MDPNNLEQQIQKVQKEGILNPTGIIPVDLFGLPANHQEIRRIADKYNLFVLEDAAQGFGGEIGRKRLQALEILRQHPFFLRNHWDAMVMEVQSLQMMTRRQN